MSEAVLFVEHSLIYSNKEPLPVKDVVNSLLAINRLSRTLLPQTLSRLTSTNVLAVDVLVDGLVHGSFQENFWLKLIFPDEATMNDFCAKIRAGDLSGAYHLLPWGNQPMIKSAAVGLALVVLISWGVNMAVGTRDDKAALATVEAHNNKIIIIGAEAYQKEPETFLKIIEEVAGPKRKELASDAARIIAPAHREPEASVSLDGRADLTFPNEVVRETPTAVDFEPYEVTERFLNVIVDIRKTNRDSATKGWYGHIVGMFDNRVKLAFNEGISTDDLAGKLSVYANVAVLYRMNQAKGELRPERITIEEILPVASL